LFIFLTFFGWIIYFSNLSPNYFSMQTFAFSAINLGCSKNLVDLEFLIGRIFQEKNFEIQFYDNPSDSEVEFVIINTCGFLSSSRFEAENILKQYDDLGKKLILMGCYVEVKDDAFLASLQNLHAILPHNDSKEISKIFSHDKIESLKEKLKNAKLETYLKTLGVNNRTKPAFVWNSDDQRAYFQADYGYEFLKIAEGCDNHCSFCIIPAIRGKQTSRTIEDIVVEVKNMVALWVKEIQIISQDTTRYGTDLYGEPRLLELLDAIDVIEGDFKYRLYYLYPDVVTLDQIERLSHLNKFIPYFDIPMQHIAPKILKNMGRFYDDAHIVRLLEQIRTVFPWAFLHTNFIVGFPWETQEDFEVLKDFAQKYRFDSVSMFGYHDEPLAASSKLPDKVDDQEILRRVEELSHMLEEIYEEKYEERRGKELTGYIHEISWKKYMIRPELSAPEIDEYDMVPLKNILDGNLALWEKVKYRLK